MIQVSFLYTSGQAIFRTAIFHLNHLNSSSSSMGLAVAGLWHWVTAGWAAKPQGLLVRGKYRDFAMTSRRQRDDGWRQDVSAQYSTAADDGAVKPTIPLRRHKPWKSPRRVHGLFPRHVTY